MAEAVMLEVRERRGPFGRFVKFLFFAFQALTILGMLGTCALFPEFTRFSDTDLAMESAAYTGLVLAGLWVVWPLGTLVLGALMLLTRGRRRLIPAPSPAGPVPQPLSPQGRAASVPETGTRR